MSWSELEREAPELAAFGVRRLTSGVAYLATVREDGSPRVHPVSPDFGRGRLFVFMQFTSPKGHDLRRDERYAVHSSVGEAPELAEVLLSGRAVPVEDPETRALAVRSAGGEVPETDVLFELGVESALTTVYEDGRPKRRRWNRGGEP